MRNCPPGIGDPNCALKSVSPRGVLFEFLGLDCTYWKAGMERHSERARLSKPYIIAPIFA